MAPDGDYAAELIDVRAFTNAHGPRVGFCYRLLEANTTVMHSASASRSASGKLAEIARNLTGREPEPAELTVAALATLAGLRCRVRVQRERNRSGKHYLNVIQVRALS